MKVTLRVSDFNAGEQGAVEYKVVRYLDVFGEWGVEVQQLKPDGKWKTRCTSRGLADYLVNEHPPVNNWTLKTFVGKACRYSEGKYRAVLTHKLAPVAGGEVPVTRTEGNVFTVY